MSYSHIQALPPSSHVIVAMSGGVDSSVSALLLKNHGHRVTGLFARCWKEDDDSSCSYYEQDYQDVAYTCSLLDIPFHTVDLTKEYQKHVFDDFLRNYKNGFTPNPDILCNRHIKFDHLYKHAKALGGEYFATGHYCRSDGKYLYKAKDLSKDQSYFLYNIHKNVLSHTIFPLQELYKSEVREIAKQHNLPSHNKKDSTGLCFIGKRKFQDFLSHFLKKHPGEFRTLDETCVGTHNGSHLYTPGQRRQLGLGGAGKRWYVIRKDMKHNIVYVHRGDNHPLMFQKSIFLSEVHWLLDTTPTQWPLTCMAKIRHLAADTAISLEPADDPKTLEVTFEKPQKNLAQGQSLVLYQNDKCLGGGIMNMEYTHSENL